MAKTNRQKGVTLIELMVTVTILAIIAVMAAPSFSNYLNNRKIRNLAESIAAGIQIAKLDAVKENAIVEFTLESSSNSWVVRRVDNPDGTPSRTDIEGFSWDSTSWTSIANLTISPSDSNTVSFDGIGRMRDNNIAAESETPPVNSTRLNQIDVGPTTPTPPGIYPARVEISLARGVRVCYLHLPPSDPKGCTL